MNKLLLSAAIIATLGVAALVPQVASATTANPVSNNGPDGTITISGAVIAQTCKVDNNAAGTVDTKTVTLPTVLTSQLASAGQTTGSKPFSIAVTGCDSALSSVHTYFSGGNINTTDGRLTNTGTASNVEVQLLNSDNTVIGLSAADGSQNSEVATLTNGAATLNYAARYYATGVSGAGSVVSTVNFTMIYQ